MFGTHTCQMQNTNINNLKTYRRGRVHKTERNAVDIFGKYKYNAVLDRFPTISYYRVFFSKGPTQKSFKYGIGPTQQDKMAKYTGPTQSYQMSEMLTNNFCC